MLLVTSFTTDKVDKRIVRIKPGSLWVLCHECTKFDTFMANMASRIASAGVLDDLFLWGMSDPAPPLQDLQPSGERGPSVSHEFSRRRLPCPRLRSSTDPFKSSLADFGVWGDQIPERSSKQMRSLRVENVLRQMPPSDAGEKMKLVSGPQLAKPTVPAVLRSNMQSSK